MAENNLSPRLRLPIPSRDQDPYYEAFLALIDALDATLYGPAHEDRNIVLMSSATVSLDSGGALAWSAAIDLLSAPQGLLWTLPAGSVTLADGQILYVQVTRAPLSSMGVTAVVGAKAPLPGSDPQDTVVLAVRRGNVVFFRNGITIAVGTTGPIFSSGGSGGGVLVQVNGTAIATRPIVNFIGAAAGADNPGATRVDLTLPRRGVQNEVLSRYLPLALNRDTDSNTWITLGHLGINVAEFDLTGSTRTFHFDVMGYSSIVGTTGQVEITNTSDPGVTATITVNATTPGGLTTALAATSGIYRLRYRAQGSTGPAERFFLDSAGIRVVNTWAE